MVSSGDQAPTLTDVLRVAIRQSLAAVHVSIPASVTRYDPAKQVIDAQPLIRRPLQDEDGENIPAEKLPVIPNVPVAWPRGGGFFMTMPLEPGDLVTLVFADRSIDGWKGAPKSGASEVRDPLDYRIHNLSDAVAIPGAYPLAAGVSDSEGSNAVFGRDNGGMQLHVTGGDVVELRVNGAATHPVALADKLQDKYLELEGMIRQHTHPFVGLAPTVAGNTAPTTSPVPPWDSTINSARLKVES